MLPCLFFYCLPICRPRPCLLVTDTIKVNPMAIGTMLNSRNFQLSVTSDRVRNSTSSVMRNPVTNRFVFCNFDTLF